MKHLALLLALTMPAHAGGPVVEEAEVTAPDRKVPTVVWIILGAAVVAAIAGQSDNCYGDESPVAPGPVC